MRRGARRLLEEPASGGDRLVGDDGAFGQERAEGGGQRVGREGTRGQGGAAGLLDHLAVLLRTHRVGERLEGADRVLGQGRQLVNLAAVGREHARLVGIGEERHRGLGADEDEMANVFQDGQGLIDGIG